MNIKKPLKPPTSFQMALPKKVSGILEGLNRGKIKVFYFTPQLMPIYFVGGDTPGRQVKQP